MGGGHLQEAEAERHLLEAALSNTNNSEAAQQTILDGLRHGMASPLDPPGNSEHPNREQAIPREDSSTPPDTELYLFSERGTSRWKETHNGRILVPLANFTIKIAEELEFDDGEESSLNYKIKGECQGNLLPEMQVSAKQFGSLNFVPEKYGAHAQIFPPASSKTTCVMQSK